MTRSQVSENVRESVADFAGSWKFVFGFLGGIGTWLLVNQFTDFDHQNISLNLLISIATALIASFVLMHERTHEARDRKFAEDHMALTREVRDLATQLLEDGMGPTTRYHEIWREQAAKEYRAEQAAKELRALLAKNDPAFAAELEEALEEMS